MSLEDDYAKVLATPEGRHVIMEHMLRTGVFSVGMQLSADKDYYNALRDAGIMMLDKVLDVGPKCLTMMMEENIERDPPR